MFLPNLSDFQSTFTFVQHHGYLIIFLIMFLEGPTVTAAAAFSASLGLFNIGIVILLSITADFLADLTYFFIGRKFAKPVIHKYGKHISLTKDKVNYIHNILKDNLAKAIITVKITPGISAPGLIVIGSSKISFKKYLLTCLAFIIPSSLLFAGIGYFFGFAFSVYAKYMGIGKEVVIIILIFIILLFVIRKIYLNIMRKVEKRLGK